MVYKDLLLCLEDFQGAIFCPQNDATASEIFNSLLQYCELCNITAMLAGRSVKFGIFFQRNYKYVNALKYLFIVKIKIKFGKSWP